MKAGESISSGQGKDTSAAKANADNLAAETGLTNLSLKKDAPAGNGLPNPNDLSKLAAGNLQVIQQKNYQQMADNRPGGLPLQRKEQPNQTGLPDNLKSGVEQLSGESLQDVKVHYNSSEPAQLNAHAFAQGTDIHIAPGQETHLPHEAWHVAQQKQGRVQATTQLAAKNVNDDPSLEKEADHMGAQAAQFRPGQGKLESGMEQSANADISDVISRFNPTVQKVSATHSFTVTQWKTIPGVIQKVDANKLVKPAEIITIDTWVKNELVNKHAYAKPIYALGSYGRKELNYKSDLDIFIETPGLVKNLKNDIMKDPGIQAIYNPDPPPNIEFESPAKVDLGAFRELTGAAVHSAKITAAKANYVAGAGAPVFAGLAGGISFDNLIDGLKTAMKNPAAAVAGGNEKVIKELIYKKLYAYIQGLTLAFGVNQDITNSIDRINEVKKAVAVAAPPIPLLQPLENVFNRTLILRTKDITAFTAAEKKEVTSDPFKDVLRSVLANSANYNAAAKNQLLLTVPAPGGCCFITTACVQAKGLPDDCQELMALRAYRDSYLRKIKDGAIFIETYYRFSPGIVDAINRRENARAIYEGLFDVIQGCVRCIRRREDELAFYIYAGMVMVLKEEFIPEVSLPESINRIFN